MSKVAWIGLGTMGFPMAGHLKTRGGYDVTVFNRTRGKADAWVAKFGGRSAPSPAAAAEWRGVRLHLCRQRRRSPRGDARA